MTLKAFVDGKDVFTLLTSEGFEFDNIIWFVDLIHVHL